MAKVTNITFKDDLINSLTVSVDIKRALIVANGIQSGQDFLDYLHGRSRVISYDEAVPDWIEKGLASTYPPKYRIVKELQEEIPSSLLEIIRESTEVLRKTYPGIKILYGNNEWK